DSVGRSTDRGGTRCDRRGEEAGLKACTTAVVVRTFRSAWSDDMEVSRRGFLGSLAAAGFTADGQLDARRKPQDARLKPRATSDDLPYLSVTEAAALLRTR